jgi:hypothetical protein
MCRVKPLPQGPLISGMPQPNGMHGIKCDVFLILNHETWWVPDGYHGKISKKVMQEAF